MYYGGFNPYGVKLTYNSIGWRAIAFETLADLRAWIQADPRRDDVNRTRDRIPARAAYPMMRKQWERSWAMTPSNEPWTIEEESRWESEV